MKKCLIYELEKLMVISVTHFSEAVTFAVGHLIDLCESMGFTAQENLRMSAYFVKRFQAAMVH